MSVAYYSSVEAQRDLIKSSITPETPKPEKVARPIATAFETLHGYRIKISDSEEIPWAGQGHAFGSVVNSADPGAGLST